MSKDSVMKIAKQTLTWASAVFGVILLVRLLSGCGRSDVYVVTNDYHNEITDRQKLVVEFRTPDVFIEPDDTDRFIVRDTNGAVWFVRSGRSNERQAGKTMIFGPRVSGAIQLEDSVLSTNR